MQDQPFQKGRGAQINPANPFHQHNFESGPILEEDFVPTQFMDVHPKSILNKVDSPDIGMAYSMNPYQGCEHGCTYCYARNTHRYWGYSAGIDFEQKIMVKRDAPKLLEETLKKKSWKAVPIMLSGNTDCYQPIEKELEITRQILQVLWKYRHPVGIITKNAMVLRDLDILESMANENLVKVSISITTMQEDVRTVLEPRTSIAEKRFQAVEKLSQAGVPVNVMIAPIIPGLTDHELLSIAQESAKRGANSIHYTMVRLNGDVAQIFEDWLQRTMPDRAEKILNKIRACHDGKLNDSTYGRRIRGDGNVAEIINQQYQLAKRLYFSNKVMPKYNLELHEHFKDAQLRLF